MLNKPQIDNIVRIIVSGCDPEKVIIFGSYAKGTANNDSDLDLFIIKKTDEPFFQRCNSIRRLFNPSLVSMDIFVYTPEEYDSSKSVKSFIPYIVENEGKVVYEKG